jgi:hypothetical protein
MQIVKPFSDGVLITAAWERFKEKFGLLILAMLTFIGVVAGIGLVGVLLSEVHEILTLIFILIAILASLVMAPGMTKLYLNILDHKDPKIGDLFSQARRAWPYFAVKFLYGLIVMGGFILFVIPGIYWALEFSLAPWLVVDKNMKVMDAFRESARLTNGYKWDILAFYKVMSMVMSFGAIIFILGALLTKQIGILGYAAMYRQIESGKVVMP